MSGISDELMLQFINASLREVFNLVGDQAWFLRRTTQMVLNEPPAVTTMPAVVKRLYRLERTDIAGTFIDWTFIRHSDAGELVILPRCGGTVIAHYLDIPEDLVTATEPTPFPYEHNELLMVSTSVKVAESVGNAALQQILLRRKERLLAIFRRDCQRYERMRKGAVAVIESRAGWATSMSDWGRS